MIAVVDNGVADLASVMAARGRLGADAEITSDPAKIASAERVILPGVGSAAAAMTQLHDKELIGVLRGLTRPVLGICLAMQLLLTRSAEGDTPCLAIIPGEVALSQGREDMPVPHMGWNTISIEVKDHPLLRNVTAESFVYFVHSFAAPPGPFSVALTCYGNTFTAIAEHKHFLGCQFHPERSGTLGSQILRNFLDI